MATNLDRTFARELALYIENDAGLYRQQYKPIALNFARKKVKGQFNKQLAIKGIIHLVESGRRKYSKEFGARGQILPMNAATKEECAKLLFPGIHDEANYFYKKMKALKDAGKPWTLREA
ncbi:MAG: hypothetical protein WC489_06220 [Patescibacteria group bacterium]|jgi:hypothetical protein